MDRIFISYSSCDRNIADQLLHYLEDRGIPCWISFRDITSGNFSGEITRALRAADIVLVICSTQSCRSEHVKNEVSLAFNQKKHIIAVEKKYISLQMSFRTPSNLPTLQ